MTPAELPLKDIHLPPPPSWWPPAPGWWLLLACALLTAIGLYFYLQRRRLTRGKREALAELRRLARRYEAARDDHALAAELSTLLRRVVLSVCARPQVAGLAGGAWLELLDSLSPRAVFDARSRRALLEAPYRRGEPVDGSALIAASERWLRAVPLRVGFGKSADATPDGTVARRDARAGASREGFTAFPAGVASADLPNDARETNR